jgi:hypothetical protein
LLKAVDAMAHRSSIRQRIQAMLSKTNGDRIVQYSLDQTARPITLRVVIVGDPAGARAMEKRLRSELAANGEPSAAVAVWAVSDATAVSALSARLADVPVLPTPEPPPPPPPPAPLAQRVRDAWPSQAGTLVSIWTMDGSSPRVRVSHLGPELGAAGREMLGRAVAVDGEAPEIEEHTLVSIEGDPKDPTAWLSRALAMLSQARELSTVYFCVRSRRPHTRTWWSASGPTGRSFRSWKPVRSRRPHRDQPRGVAASAAAICRRMITRTAT